MSLELPMIRLTLEHMREEVLHHFNLRCESLRDEVTKAMDEAIRSFDYRGEIAKITGEVIRKELASSIGSAFGALAWDATLRKELVAVVIQRLKEKSGNDV